MLVSMKYILQDAHEDNYAVMAMNCVTLEMAKAAINAAEAEKSPIILQMGQGQMARLADPDGILPAIKSLASKATVPIAVHLDHGQLFDVEVDCIKRGFTSVMIDASMLSFEENVNRTKTIVRLARPHGISVEAELGHVGQAADGDGTTEDYFTNPQQAKEFVERTGIDALAVAIGTAHGAYPKGMIPKLDFERLALLKKTLNMPLVLHGGSGAGDENIRKAVANGINKINVATDAFKVAKDAMIQANEKNPNLDYLELCIIARDTLTEFIRNYMRLIGSNNRYYYGKTEVVGHE